MYKVGIFGTGQLAKAHLTNWKEITDVSIAGFFDPNDEAAAETESLFAVKRYTSEEDLINNCDIIDVAYPTNRHFAICEKAMRKGKHVFVEKPMTHTMSEAEQLVKLVQESNIKLQVGHVERYNPAFLSLKGIDLNPMFVEAHRLTHYKPQGNEVSLVLDLMIHDIDIVLSVVKSEVKHITASGVAVITDTADMVNARIEFNNGCVANLTSSRISTKQLSRMQLFQKDACIGIDFLNKKAEIIRAKRTGDDQLSSFDIDTTRGAQGMAIESSPVPQINPLKLELQEFLASIRNNTRTRINEIDGYRAMEVAHLILKKTNSNLTTAR